MINFISNLPADLRTGGFSALNGGCLDTLLKRYDVHVVAPINPPSELWRKVFSKIKRSLGARSDFFFFSRSRLSKIAADVAKHCREDANVDFFHGFTPWISTSPPRPYIAFSDCTFRDYANIFHKKNSFSTSDLRRIELSEANWLKRAERVVFTSKWASFRAIEDYGLDPEKVEVVGIFGEIEMPVSDCYDGAQRFVFVSTAFHAKGGDVVLEAFRLIRAFYPDAQLSIVGDAPDNIGNLPGVTVEGFLRKEDVVENQRLRELLGGSCALIHPTNIDICPLILIESGYFGCPVISSRSFAIPEIVSDGETGFLLNNPCEASSVADSMAWMLRGGESYSAMRKAAWVKSRSEYSKSKFEERLLDVVEAAVPYPGDKFTVLF